MLVIRGSVLNIEMNQPNVLNIEDKILNFLNIIFTLKWIEKISGICRQERQNDNDDAYY